MGNEKTIGGIIGSVLLVGISVGVKYMRFHAREDARESVQAWEDERDEDRFPQPSPPPQINHNYRTDYEPYIPPSPRITMPPPPTRSDPIAELYPESRTNHRVSTPSTPREVVYYTPGAVEQDTGDQQTHQQQTTSNSDPGVSSLGLDPSVTAALDPISQQQTQTQTTQTASNDTASHNNSQPQAPDLDLTHSPAPETRTLTRYPLWHVNQNYNMLGRSFEIAGWSFQPSTEFEQTGGNARVAEWSALGGTRGIGLDLEVHTLLPRDVGMATPIIEDAANRQTFQLGRRQARARGDAQISYKDINGLLVWRILVPAEPNSQLATCYYTAIVGDQAIVFIARYDKDRPEQMNGFDAMLGTLRFTPPQ